MVGGDASAAVLDALHAHVAVLDGAGRIRWVNAAWRRFGAENGLASPAACVGMDYLEACRVDPDLHAVLGDVLARRIPAVAREYPCHSPSDERWFALHAAPLVGEPGMVVSHVDITVPRRTAVVRAEIAARYGTLFAAARDGMVILDADGATVIEVNAAFTAMVQRAAAELVGQPARTLFPELVAEAACQRLDRQLRDQLAVPVEVTLRQGRDGAVPAELVASRVFDPAGGWAFLIVRDASPRLALERERARLAAAALQAQKLEAMGQLAAGVAHDMNNTLATIAGTVAELGARTPAAGELLTDAIDAITRGKELTRSLLTLGSGAPAVRAPFDLGALVHRCGRMLERVLPRAIALRIRLEPSAPMIIDGDEGQWHQALLNLALNARDAMPDGGRLELAAHRDGDYAVLEVADDGAGMSPDTRARAFEPFFTTKGTQGTGLGLAHGYAVARAHGAILELTSELGRGTTVRLRIAAMALPAAVAAPASAPATALVGAAVIVDDEPAVRRSTSRLASRLGLTVEAVASAAEALEALARGPEVAYLVTDLSMPEVDGLALARTARARWPALGIVVVSGNAGAEVLAALAALGAQFLAKPFLPAQLRAALVGAAALAASAN
jgi:PAS domain S-box-containing protein